jgi:hypothetical protein
MPGFPRRTSSVKADGIQNLVLCPLVARSKTMALLQSVDWYKYNSIVVSVLGRSYAGRPLLCIKLPRVFRALFGYLKGHYRRHLSLILTTIEAVLLRIDD